MAKADSKHTTETPIATQVANGLSDFESPLLCARDLIYAARMAASAHDMLKEGGAALEVLADTILDQMNALIEERERLWRLALECEGGLA